MPRGTNSLAKNLSKQYHLDKAPLKTYNPCLQPITLHTINQNQKQKQNYSTMAQAMASMTGLSQLLSGRQGSLGRSRLTVRAQQLPVEGECSRRAALGIVATSLVTGAFTQAVLAEAKSIKIGPPPPPSGGLAGTENSDQARDLDLPLKNRFYLQPLSPTEAAARVKESAKDIINLKSQIDKKAWPYVMNDLRLRASYLRYDLKTVISAKPLGEKKPLKDLTNQLFSTIDELDYAAKMKSAPQAEKSYAATKSILDDVLAKLG